MPPAAVTVIVDDMDGVGVTMGVGVRTLVGQAGHGSHEVWVVASRTNSASVADTRRLREPGSAARPSISSDRLTASALSPLTPMPPGRTKATSASPVPLDPAARSLAEESVALRVKFAFAPAVSTIGGLIVMTVEVRGDDEIPVELDSSKLASNFSEENNA